MAPFYLGHGVHTDNTVYIYCCDFTVDVHVLLQDDDDVWYTVIWAVLFVNTSTTSAAIYHAELHNIVAAG